MDRWIGIGLFCGGLAWAALTSAVANLPAIWDYRPFGSNPVFAAMSVALLSSGLAIIHQARRRSVQK